MGKLPALLLAVVALWLALNVIQHGPEEALGGLFGLFNADQYGESDAPSRSSTLADEILDDRGD